MNKTTESTMSSSNEKITIIWDNKGEFYKRLKKLEKEIKNVDESKEEESHQYSNLASLQIIDCQEKFDLLQIVKDEKLIVLAELNWKGKSRTDFYGLDLIRKIRFEKGITAPITLISIVRLEYMMKVVNLHSTFQEVENNNIYDLAELIFRGSFDEIKFLSEKETMWNIIKHFIEKEKSAKYSYGHEEELFANLVMLIFNIQRNLNGNKVGDYKISQIHNLWKNIFPQLSLLNICIHENIEMFPSGFRKSLIELNMLTNSIHKNFNSKNFNVKLLSNEILNELRLLKNPLDAILNKIENNLSQ